MLVLSTRAWPRPEGSPESPPAFAKRVLDLGAPGVLLDPSLALDSDEVAALRQAGAPPFAAELPGGLATSQRDRLDHLLRLHLDLLDLADRMAVRVLIVPLGDIDADLGEADLLAGDQPALRRLLEKRAHIGSRPFDHGRFALDRLVRRAESLGLQVVVPNGARVSAIPSFQELERLGSDLAGGPFGLFFDSAAAWCIERLGLRKAVSWVETFGSVLVGGRLHDAAWENQTLAQHLAPGEGVIDFETLGGAFAKAPPRDRLFAAEVDATRDTGRLREGLDRLRKAGFR